MGWNLGNLTYLIICTGFPTSCEVKHDILGQISINNHFKQPCAVGWNYLFGLMVILKLTACTGYPVHASYKGAGCWKKGKKFHMTLHIGRSELKTALNF